MATTPTVRGVTEGAGASSTTHTITFTQTTGDRVVIFLANDSTARTWSLGDSFVNLTNTSATFHIFTKVLDGSEGGNMVATAGVATKSAWLAYNITTGTHASGTAPVFSTVATGTSTAPNSGSLSPSGGSAKYLWLSAFGQAGEEADDDTWTSAAPSTPGTFTGLVQKTTGTSGAVTVNGSVAAAQYASETATVDPGAFTVAQSLAWRAYTVAIYPNTQTNYTQTAGDSLGTLSETNVRVAARARTGADSLGGGAYAATVLADSPVAYWRLGEASGYPQDSAGTNHVTATTGSPTYGVTGALTGDANTSITLASSGQYFEVPHASAIDLGDGPWSIEFWFRSDTDTGAAKTIISKGTDSYLVNVRQGTPDTMVLDKVGLSGYILAATGDATADGLWHHWVCVRYGTGASNTLWYRDGVEGHSDSLPGTSFTTSSGTLLIGNEPSQSLGPAGGLDEIALYASTLSSTRVAAHYAAGTSGGITEAAVGVKTAGEGSAKVRTSGDTLGTLSEATIRAFVGTRTVAGTTIGTLSEAAVRIAAVARTAGDSIGTLSETAVRAVIARVRAAGDSLGTLSEAAVRAVAAKVRTAGDTVGTLSEASVRVIGWVRSAGDSLGTLTEAAVRAQKAWARSAGDTIGTLSEAATRLAVRARTAGDTVGTLSESAVRAAAAKARSAAETIGTLTDSATRAFVGSRAVGDALGAISEAVVGVKSGVQAWVATAGETIGTLTEAAVRAFIGTRSAGDSIGSLSEVAARIAARARAAGDTVGTLSEAAIRAAIDRVRIAGDTVGTLSETAVRAAAAKMRAAGDTVGTLSEAVVGVKSGVQAWVATAGDAIGSLGESIVRAFVGSRTGGDTVGTLTEAAVRIAARARAAGDSIPTLGEAVSRLGAFLRPVGDTVPTLTEVVVGVQAGLHAFVRAASDVIGSLLESAGWPVNPGGVGPRGTAGRTGIDATASHDEPSGTATRATSAGTAGHDEPSATAAHQEPRV